MASMSLLESPIRPLDFQPWKGQWFCYGYFCASFVGDLLKANPEQKIIFLLQIRPVQTDNRARQNSAENEERFGYKPR